MSSQVIFNDGFIKSRLIRKDKNWFVGEWKYVNEEEPSDPYYLYKKQWFPWICGTKEWLQLTEQDIEWSK